jgi:5-methylcytosine-specific restriction endonuclease McrA
MLNLLLLVFRLLCFQWSPHPPVTRYERYLATAHWRRVRRLVLARDGHRCRQCGCSHGLNVHHRTYAHMGHEEEHLGDLVTLCRRHHNQQHGR